MDPDIPPTDEAHDRRAAEAEAVGVEPGVDEREGDGALIRVLERSRELGLLGPGPVAAHISHSLAWSALIPEGARVLDLGSGGGVPGLPLAVHRVDCTLVLLDSMSKRGTFLREAVAALALGRRVDVVVERAEAAGRDDALRGRFDVVAARSFGAPAVTAECAAPFLRPGGWLLVSEPPDAPPERWDDEGLGLLGLTSVDVVARDATTIRRFQQVTPCPDTYPRPVGRPAKRPLF